MRPPSVLLLLLLLLPSATAVAFVPVRFRAASAASAAAPTLSSQATVDGRGEGVAADAPPPPPPATDADSSSWIERSYNENIDTSPVAPTAAPVSHLHPLERATDEPFVGPRNVLVYDTTLRDGTQGESVSASCQDKLKIAARLAEFGVDYIEAGWPGSNPKDAEFFARAPEELTPLAQSKLVAFGSTRRKNVRARDDPQLQALLDANVPTVCLVAKSHAWQVTDILRCALDENLHMISDSVAYLVGKGKTVLVDLEHFFDGYKESPEYAMLCCQAAVDAGASSLVLCDTNGASMPWQVADISKAVVSQFRHHQGDETKQTDDDNVVSSDINPRTTTVKRQPVTIGIHTHNDCGMAVANSLQACHSGIGLVQGTVNGIGERTGNADLCSIIPSLALHIESNISCRPRLSKLTQLSRWIDETLNRTPNQAAPYVGASAFAHKGGLHVAAMERSSKSYQHIEPEHVGNEKRVLISELSGRQNILAMLKEIFGDHSDSDSDSDDDKGKAIEQSDRAVAILQRVKELEHQGYTFEGAEASVHLMILHAGKGYCPPFSVLDYSAQVYDQRLDSASRVLAAQQRQEQLQRSRGSNSDSSQNGDNDDDSNSNSEVLGISSSSTSRATVKVRTIVPNEERDGDAASGDNNRTIMRNSNFDHTPIDEHLNYRDTLEVSDGSGPVDALANALRRALVPTYPHLLNVELVDYKVRILDPTSATNAATRVMIEFRDNVSDATWTTVSVDRNVISASLNALVDGLEYALVEHASLCMLCDDAYNI